MGQLEIAHLQDVRKGLDDIDQTHQQQHQGHIQGKGHADHRAAQKQGAGVAHKDLGRVEIIAQKAAQAAQQCRRERGKAPMCRGLGKGDHREKEHDRHGNAAGQTVDAVGQIDRVDAADDGKHGDRQIQKLRHMGHRLLDKGDIQVVFQRPGKVHGRQENGRRQHLEQELLHPGQAQVALLFDLDKIIVKADQAEHNRKSQHQKMGIVTALHGLPAGDDAQKRRGNEHQAAHGRGTCLAVVPFRPHLADGLSRF